MMTDEEIIAVVSAHKEGKKIEIQEIERPQNGWFVKDYPLGINWDFTHYRYRVAPENAHLVTGYCFPKDISLEPIVGMVKVKQVHLDENPLPHKPREWLLCDGTDHERWVVVDARHANDLSCQGEKVRVREVLEPDRDTKTWWAEIPTDGSVTARFLQIHDS